MIATLNGVVSEKLPDQVVIDVQGVGYGVYMTPEDEGRLSTGSEIKVYVYEYVREQVHDGIADADEFERMRGHEETEGTTNGH